MALIPCPDCKLEFSETLSSCPECYWSRERNNEKSSLVLPIFIVLVAFLLGCTLLYIYSDNFESILPKGTVDKDIRSSWGALGDFFGGALNPILAFLGLIMLAVTLRLNIKELSLSRQVLTETRKDISVSSKALSEQADSLQLQNFESTFFSLLEVYQNNVDSIKTQSTSHQEDSEHEKQGKQAFAFFASRDDVLIENSSELGTLYGYFSEETQDLHSAKDELDTERENLNTPTKWNRQSTIGNETIDKALKEQKLKDKTRIKEIDTKITDINNQIDSDRYRYHGIDDKEEINQLLKRVSYPILLDHYFSIIELLLTYIKDNSNNNQFIEKSFYDELVKSQMSFGEIYYLFFALIGDEKLKNLKLLSTEAALFENISSKDLFYGENHMRHYERKAFGLSGKWD